MKKILISSLITVLPLSTGITSFNYFLKESNEIKNQWINDAKIYNQYIFNKIQLFENQKLIINSLQNEFEEKIIEIYAKTPNKKYYLNLNNYENYETNDFLDLIKNKFYQEKTTEKFISGNDYFALFDTSSNQEGKIINDAELGFRSSWGVRNSADSTGLFSFNLQEEVLKNHIILNNKNNYSLKHKEIDILSIKPLKIAVLPLVKVIDPPIANAFWTTNEIKFDSNLSKNFNYSNVQKLILPEGAQVGQHWTNWFKSAFGTLLGLGSIGTGFHSILKSNPITGIISLVLGIAGVVWEVTSNALNKSSNSLIPKKIFDDINDVQKIYNRIIENSFYIYNSFDIQWNKTYFSTYIMGKLYAEAWSTAIFGQYSKINLYTAWGAMNADVKYLVYND